MSGCSRASAPAWFCSGAIRRGFGVGLSPGRRCGWNLTAYRDLPSRGRAAGGPFQLVVTGQQPLGAGARVTGSFSDRVFNSLSVGSDNTIIPSEDDSYESGHMSFDAHYNLNKVCASLLSDTLDSRSRARCFTTADETAPAHGPTESWLTNCWSAGSPSPPRTQSTCGRPPAVTPLDTCHPSSGVKLDLQILHRCRITAICFAAIMPA